MGKDPSTSESGQNDPFLSRAYHLSNVDEARTLYQEWAPQYDELLAAQDYNSPQCTADAVVQNIRSGSGEIKVLDAGCGTGLVGLCLAKSKLADRLVIDGVDLTEGMLTIARKKGVYQNLETADLTKAVQRPDGSYNAVACAGTLTKGHVGPAALDEFARVTTKGGLIVATVHDEIWESGGYKAQVEKMSANNVVDVISTDEFGIIKGETTGGRMVVLRKT